MPDWRDWRDAIPTVGDFTNRKDPLIPDADESETDWRTAVPDAPGAAQAPPKEMHRVVSMGTTPDNEAKVAQLAMRSRLPESLIRKDLRTAEAYDEYKRMRDVSASAPATARFLSIAENMAAARDDAEPLAEVERSLLAYGKANYEVGQLTVQLALLRSRQAHGDDSDATQAKIDELKGKMQEMHPGEYENIYERVVGLTGSQIPIQLYIGEQAGSYAAAGASGGALWGATMAGAPTAGVGAPVGAGAGAVIGGGAGATVGTIKASYELESGLSYDEYLDAGMDKNTAAWASKIYGGIASIIETASLGPLKKLIPGASRFTDEAIKTPVRATIKRAIFSYVKNGGKAHLYESVEEGLQTFAQDLVKWAADSYDAGQLVDWEEPTGEKMKQAVEDTLLTPIAPILGTPSLGFDLASGVKNLKTAKAFDQLEALQAMLGQMQTSEQSQQEQEALMQLRTAVMGTKTKERNPRKTEEHIQGILDRNPEVPEEIFIPAEQLVQVMEQNPGVVAPLLEELELSQGDVAEAAAQGTDLAVSTAKYAAYAMGTDLDNALVNDLRLAPNSMTASQLAEAEKTFQEDMQRHRDALVRRDEARTQVEQERQAIYEDVKSKKLATVGVKAAEENAVAMAAAFTAMSQRYGVGSPMKLYETVGLSVQRGDTAQSDETLNQDRPALAGVDLNNAEQVEEAKRLWAEMGTESPYFKAWFGDSKVVDENGKPLVVYHGTRYGGFESFDPRRSAEGGAVFFTSDPNTANIFSPRLLESDTPATYSVYLSLKNPMYVEAEDVMSENADGEMIHSSDMMEIMVSQAKHEGHDGVVFLNMPEGYTGLGDVVGTQYAVFDPTQIKSVNNQGTFSPNDARILKQDNLGFYSAASKAVAAMNFRVMPPANLIAQIKKTPGIKQEELDDLGLIDWLEGLDGKVAKEDVLEFISRGGPQLEEAVKGSAGVQVTQDMIDEAEARGDWDEQERLTRIYEDQQLGNNANDTGNETKFSQYQLPGGENYREVVVTVPNPLESKHQDGLIPKSEKLAAEYQSPHWDEANVLAHFRLNVRTDADGNKVLFIEEIQSDWHQEGRKKGYTPKVEKRPSASQPGMFDVWVDGQIHHRTINEIGADDIVRSFVESDFVPNAPFKKSWALLAFKRVLRMAAEQGYDSVAWTPGEVQAERYDLRKQISLVEYREDMRRSVKNSGRRGELESLLYRVLEDAPRPDLPNIIARMSEKEVEDTILEYSNKPESQRYKNEAVGRLYAENLDGEQVIDERMPPEKVEDYVGKEVAERLFTSEPDKDGYRTLQGLDLKVGGEGMKGFYDKILPKEVGKYVKKLDKGVKVGVGNIVADDIDKSLPWEVSQDEYAGWYVHDKNDPTSSFEEGFKSKKAALKWAEENMASYDTQEVWSLPITDKMREEILKGQPLYQDVPSGVNAMVNLDLRTPKGNTIVTLFNSENESSFLHESGHIFFELLGFIASRPGAPQKALDDWQVVKDYVADAYVEGDEAVSDTSGLTKKQHEKLARVLEGYFMEGKAPSLRLRQVFQKFADWLKNIYRDLAGLSKAAEQEINVTPEITALMDRMFATDEEIAQAQAYYGQKDVYEAEAARISEEEQQKYLDAVEEAQTEAKDNLMRKKMAAWSKITGGKKKLRKDVTAEVDAEPVYALMAALRKEDNGRLDIGELDRLVGAETRKTLSRMNLTKNDGSDPEIRAASYGFATVDEMVDALLKAEKRAERINRIVNQRMAEKIQELEKVNSVEGMADADAEVHTDAKLAVLFMELDMLRKQFARDEAAPDRALRSLTTAAKRNAVKAAARKRLDSMKVKDARRYDTFSRAEAKASREARTALEKGDYTAAEQAKLREIINHAMVIEAVKFREEVAAAERMVTKAKTQKSMLPESRDLINDIALRFGLNSAPQSRTAKLFEAYRAQMEAAGEEIETVAQWASRMEDEGFTVFAPDWLDSSPARPYQRLTVDQFRDVADTIRSIKTADRMQRIVITDEKGRTRKQLAEDLTKWAEENATRRRPPDRNDTSTRKLVNATHAWHMKIETVLIDLDGGKPGLFWETFYLPFEKAYNAEQERLKEANAKINEIFGAFSRKRQIEMSTEKVRIDAIGKSLTKWQIIMAVANMGNEGNMARLVEGEKWTAEQAKAVLDVLEKDEMDFVQAVWDYFDTFRAESFALERKLTGRTPKRVEPKALETRHGVYPGGYFPVVSDPGLGLKAAYRQLKDSMTGGGSLKGTHHAAAATRRNHLKERTRGTGEQLLLDPTVISNHIFQVIHDITHREAVQGVAQLARDSKVLDIMQGYAGFDATKAMSSWVMDIAAEQNGPQSPIHKFARWARTGTTLMSMGFKATTMTTQFVGYTSTIDQLKGWDKKYAGIGLATAYRNPKRIPALLRETFEKSTFMEGRMKSFDRDIRDASKRVGSMAVESKRIAKALGYVDVGSAKVAEFAFTHIGAAQMMVDLPTWWAMYAKTMDETGDEVKAVRDADSFVRQTQGSGATKDLARIQRGDELMRLFTMFYSFFNTLYNMAYLSGRYVQKKGFTPGGVAAAASSTMLLWFLPSLLAELVAGRGPDRDDDEEWVEWAAPIVGLYPTQSVVVLRDVANYLGTDFGYSMTPAQSSVKSLGKWLGAVNKAWEEEDTTLLVKPTAEAVGYLAHLPLGQALITGQNLFDYATGEDPELYFRDLFYKKPKSRQ